MDAHVGGIVQPVELLSQGGVERVMVVTTSFSAHLATKSNIDVHRVKIAEVPT